MSTINEDTLQQLTTEALERTAFVLADPTDHVGHAAQPRHASIAYTGGQSGAVYVSASDGFLTELASSLLGVEPGEVNVETEGIDALCELANILGGSLLNDLGGVAETFQLGLPALIDTPPECSADAISCAVRSEEGTLTVTWQSAA